MNRFSILSLHELRKFPQKNVPEKLSYRRHCQAKRNCAFPLQIDQMLRMSVVTRKYQRKTQKAGQIAQSFQFSLTEKLFPTGCPLDKVVILTVTMSFYCFIRILLPVFAVLYSNLCSKFKLMAFESLSELISFVSLVFNARFFLV